MKIDYLQFNDKDEYLTLIDPDDSISISDKMWKSFFETYEESDSMVIYLVRTTNKETNEDTVVATYSLVIEPKIYLPGPVVKVEDLIVKHKYRNLGIGTKIMKEAEKQALSYNASIFCCNWADGEGKDLSKFIMKALDSGKEEAVFGIGFFISKDLRKNVESI